MSSRFVDKGKCFVDLYWFLCISLVIFPQGFNEYFPNEGFAAE